MIFDKNVVFWPVFITFFILGTLSLTFHILKTLVFFLKFYINYIMSKYVSIITVTYINSSEAIASQALAENMMEKIALDNGCDRVRCYLSGEVTRLIVFEYNEETIQKKL